MLKLAILGAGGFIGSRAIELFHLTRAFDVRPVVRRPGAMARAARFRLDCRVADVLDRDQLEDAFRGCDAVLHLATGDPRVIAGGVRPVHEAASRAGVRRIVYMSSASVHGQAPDAGTDEEAPLHRRHALPYNNAKVEAEREWKRLRQRGGPEVVVLRPAIVFGPRSRWVASCAEELLEGRAYLVDAGRGICNTVYVDNLLHAVRLALTVPQAGGETYFVGDRERMTWLEFYEPIARALGIDPATIPRLDRVPDLRPGVRDRLRALKSTTPIQFGLRYAPLRLKRSVKAAVAAWGDQNSAPSSGARTGGPQPTLEMTLLQQCQWQLPWSKATAALGYQPVVSSAEGMRRSIAWLGFAGYPIQ
jgi:nucleoside-diphosphate-sugar epimerase